MTALAATDITVTFGTRRIHGKQKRNAVKLAFGNGTLTYPSGGVPIPAVGVLGMVRNLEHLIIYDQDAGSGIIWKYDTTNSKLRAYLQGVVVGAAGAVTVDDFPLDTTTDTLSTAVSMSLTDSAGAGTKYFGKLKEMATTQAPPATEIRVEAVGW